MGAGSEAGLTRVRSRISVGWGDGGAAGCLGSFRSATGSGAAGGVGLGCLAKTTRYFSRFNRQLRNWRSSEVW